MVSGQNLFDGIANGTAPSVANSGGTSGDAISGIDVGAASTILASTTGAIHGARGCRFTLAGSTSDGASRVKWAVSETGRLVFSFYVNYASVPTQFEDVGGFTNTGSTKILVASIGADGKLIIANAAGAYQSASRAPNVFPTGPVRVDIAVAPGTTTANGYLGYAYYLGDSTTVVYSWESSAQNSGTTAIAGLFIGRTTGRAEGRTVDYDTVRWLTQASGFLDPYTTTGGTSGSITQVGINTAEGLAAGTTLTSGSASATGGASGTACSSIAVGAASTITVTNANASHGNRAYAFNYVGNGADGATRMLWSFVRSDRAVLSFYIPGISNAITATEDLGGFRHASGNMCILTIGSDGKAIMQDATGASIAASKSTNVIPTDTPIRWDIAVKKGTGTGDGVCGYAYFVADASTPTFSWEGTAQNTGTADTANPWVGRSTGRTVANLITYDTIRFGYSGATNGVWFDPYAAAATAPIADIGGNLADIEPYTQVSIDATHSYDPDGSIASYTLTRLSGPAPSDLTGSGPIWTYTAPAAEAAQTIVWQLTVTDNTSLTSAAVSASHTILPYDIFAVQGGVLVPIQITEA